MSFPEFLDAAPAGKSLARITWPAAAAMFATLQLEHPLVAPGAAYYVFTAAGIAASLAIIAATFPLLRRITGPDVARNE